MILRDWTRETEDHLRISLVEQAQPDYQLEERGDQMATLENWLERTPWKRMKNQNGTTTKSRRNKIVDEEETKNHTKNLIKEDKNMILIELLEETAWINKMNIATELAIKENDKKEEKTDKELVPEDI